MARQAIKSYAIDPAHTNDSHAIERARSKSLYGMEIYIWLFFIAGKNIETRN